LPSPAITAATFNLHQRLDALPFFWRDKIGREVDFLVEHGSQLGTVEFKAGQTVAGDWFGSLRKYTALRQTATRAAHAPAKPVLLLQAVRSAMCLGHQQSGAHFVKNLFRESTSFSHWRRLPDPCHWPNQILNTGHSICTAL